MLHEPFQYTQLLNPKQTFPTVTPRLSTFHVVSPSGAIKEVINSLPCPSTGSSKSALLLRWEFSPSHMFCKTLFSGDVMTLTLGWFLITWDIFFSFFFCLSPSRFYFNQYFLHFSTCGAGFWPPLPALLFNTANQTNHITTSLLLRPISISSLCFFFQLQFTFNIIWY